MTIINGHGPRLTSVWCERNCILMYNKTIKKGPIKKPVVFRINDGIGPELLQQVFLERGWEEFDEQIHSPEDWNLWWRTTRFRTGEYSNLLPWQFINHFPQCTLITKKDALCRNLKKMKIIHGYNVYNFSPKAFNLPNDYTKFVSEYANHKQNPKKDGPPPMWICKPAESSRGRGIFIFHELSELQYDCNAVVQNYINDPLLIGGYKFDIRVYVAIPSFHPLQIYIHEEGLVRFSTEKYDLARLDNVFAHLTNTSINKFSPAYTTDKDEVGHGCKWTISQLRRYFLQNNIDDARIWQQIVNIIILTVLMQAPSAPKMTNCFELYGFDILIDNSLKAWLLEVNLSPALSSDCQADIVAKKSMLHDLMNLIQIPEADCDQSNNAMSAWHQLGNNLDTARTVTSTISHASYNSGMSSFRVNNGFNKHNTTHSHSSEVYRGGQRVKYSSGSVSKDRNNVGCNSSSSQTNSTRQFSYNKHNGDSTNSHTNIKSPKTSSKHKKSPFNTPPSEESQTNHPSRCGSGKAAMKKADSLPYLNIGNKDETPRNDSNDGNQIITSLNLQCEDEPTATGDNNINNNSTDIQTPLESSRYPLGLNANEDDANNHNFGDVSYRDKNDDLYEDDSRRYGVKIVRGNIKGQGAKKVISPIPMISGRKEKQNKVSSLAIARRQGKQFSVEEGLRQQQQQLQMASNGYSPPLGLIDPGNSKQRYVIPRNFSRLETNRFPLPHHHARLSNISPGKNGRAPLSKIPPKQVGKFFLVFPFNESTQKISSGTLDPKLVIKEMSKQDSKNRKSESQGRSQSAGNSGSIWAPLRGALL